jgi:hypothetical protein
MIAYRPVFVPGDPGGLFGGYPAHLGHCAALTPKRRSMAIFQYLSKFFMFFTNKIYIVE